MAADRDELLRLADEIARLAYEHLHKRIHSGQLLVAVRQYEEARGA